MNVIFSHLAIGHNTYLPYSGACHWCKVMASALLKLSMAQWAYSAFRQSSLRCFSIFIFLVSALAIPALAFSNGVEKNNPALLGEKNHLPPLDATFTCSGNANIVVREVNITNAFFALGPSDGNFAQLYETNDTLAIKLDEEVVSGSTVVIRWKKTGSTNPSVTVAQSGNNTTWTTPTSYSVTSTGFVNQSITLSTNTRYLRFRNTNGGDLQLDAVTFTSQTCNHTGGGGVPLSCSATSTSISGTTFHDVNGNGSYESANDFLGIAGVTVNAVDSLGNSFSGTTSSTGSYALTGLVANRTYRVEFHVPTSLNWLYSSFRGSDNGTTVQFIKPGNCANLGLVSPTDYCQGQPELVLPCYENGSGVGNANAAVVSMPYSGSGISPAESMDFQTQQVGSVYGAAYDRRNKRVYVSSFLKRHSGFGPRGVDGVYVLDYSTSTPTLLGGFDLQGVTPANGGANIDLGTINRTHITTAISAGAAGDYQLPSSRTEASVDLDAFGKAGTISYGDIDMSEDGRTLWMVNLNQKALIAVDIMNLSVSMSFPNTPPGSVVRQYLLSSMTGLPTCTNGTLRPFGLEFYKGKGYVGCVCDAASSSTLKKPAELDGYILSFDPANPTALTTVVSFGFDHNREASYSQLNPSSGVVAGEWQRWINTYSTSLVNTGFWVFQSAPQPIISDIEITEEGDIVVGVMDRFAHQQGWAQYRALTGDRTLASGLSTGDILKFGLSSGTYMAELGESDTKNSPAGFITNDGAGNSGEFFYGDFYTGWDASHCETGLGGITLKPGSNEIVSGTLDPMAFNSQGITWFNMGTGDQNKMYQVVGSTDIGNFGKGSALGDFELMCDPSPIEIGNYVWLDTDKDGMQDPGEQGLNGVKVSLYKLVSGTATLAASTTTATVNGLAGAYYFRDYQQYGTGFDTLALNTNYYIVLGESGGTYTWSTTNQNLNVGGSTYVLTTANNGSGTTPDQNDSDAFVFTTAGKPYTNYPVDTVTIGNAGYVNHTLDFGLRPCPTITNPSATQTICAGGTGSNITVNTTTNAANSIRFVRFTTDQMAGTTPTTTEATNIYGGTVISTVTPTGGASPYTATYIFNASDFPSSSSTYYVYAILNPDEGASCRPTQEIRININILTASTVSGDQTVCPSGDPTAFTVVSAAAGSGTLSYQWQKSTTDCASNFINISGATSAAYNPPAGLTQTTYYRVIVTSTLNSVACTATSNCITVTVLPFCETYCANNVISNSSFENNSLPGSGTFSFAGGTAVNLGTGAPVGFSKATTNGDNYWVQSSEARTGNKYIYMYSSGTTPASTDACTQFAKSSLSGNTTYTLCIFAADAKADGQGSGMSLEVQENNGGPFHWLNFLLPNNSAWSDAAATDIPWTQYCYTFTTAAATTSLTMWLSASAEQGSSTAYVVVDDLCLEPTTIAQMPTIGGSSSTAATCTGGTANNNASISLTGITNGTKADKVVGASYAGGPAYGAGSNVNVSGGTATFTGLAANTQYTFRVWNSKCDCYQDITLTTPVTCCVTASTVGSNQNICGSADPAAFTVGTVATGNGTLGYQWQKSTTNCSSGFLNIFGANAATYDPPGGLTQTSYYKVVVTNTVGVSTCTATSNCVTLTYSGLPDFTLGLATACPGASPEVTIGGLTGGTPAVSTMKINTGTFIPYAASPPNLTTSNGIVPNATNTITVRNEYGCETPKNIAVPAVVPLVCPPVIVTKSNAGSD